MVLAPAFRGLSSANQSSLRVKRSALTPPALPHHQLHTPLRGILGFIASADRRWQWVGQLQWCHCWDIHGSDQSDVTFRYGMHGLAGVTPDPSECRSRPQPLGAYCLFHLLAARESFARLRGALLRFTASQTNGSESEAEVKDRLAPKKKNKGCHECQAGLSRLLEGIRSLMFVLEHPLARRSRYFGRL